MRLEKGQAFSYSHSSSISKKGRKGAALTGEMISLITVSILLVAAIGGIASEIAFLATTAHFLEAKIIAGAVAGALSSVSSAPQNGVYCVTLPGTFQYKVAFGIGTEKASVGPALVDPPELGPYCPVNSPSYSAYEKYRTGPYKEFFDEASEKYDVPLPYILAIAYTESGIEHYDTSGNVKDSGSGYIGIMMVSDDNPENREPEGNINSGVAELRKKLDDFGGDFQAAAAAYSGGTAGAVEFIKALGGAGSWVRNLQSAEFMELEIYEGPNDFFETGGWTFGDGSIYTVEKQNACGVARNTANARFFESMGLGTAKYGFVAVVRETDKSGALSYVPVATFEPGVFKIPSGGKYTLVMKKSLFRLPHGGYKETIRFAVREGGLREAGCQAETPAICGF